MDRQDRVRFAHDLRRSARELRERGLLVAAKWACELLSALPEDIRLSPHLPFSPPPQPIDLPHIRPVSFSPSNKSRPSIGEIIPPAEPDPRMFGDDVDHSMSILSGPSGSSARGSRPRRSNGNGGGLDSVPEAEAGPSRSGGRGEYEDEERDPLVQDRFDLARSYFDMKEFDRVAWVLRDMMGPKARFLRLYSQYLSADRKAQESLPHFIDLKEERLALFPAIRPLIAELADDTDPYLVYLRGLLCMRIDHRVAAIDAFVESVKKQPYNWSAWSQLAQMIKSTEMFVEVRNRLPSSPMLLFTAITVMLDLHTATDKVLSIIRDLQSIFPHSIHLRAQEALVYYHMRDFETAEKHFEAVQQLDPYRMEEVDIYSNMLYVMDKRAKLGQIAHEYAEIDRNRAEVCCLIGNYYSSRGDHTKAILYFRRALLLNRDYLPAWTLMGHEYVELKNSHAAIEAYRKAIDVNAKDYRAWYGLGQAYELLDMPVYAIDYYNQATSLRPFDCRMWTALATVYEAQSNLGEAIRAHERALLGADPVQTMTILSKLAALHTSLAEASTPTGSAPGVSSDDPQAGAQIGDPASGAGAVKHMESAVLWHRRLILMGEAEGVGIGELAPSYVALAEWEMRFIRGVSGKKRNGREGEDGAGDLGLAAQYLRKVADTNVPQRDSAEALLRELKVAEARM